MKRYQYRDVAWMKRSGIQVPKIPHSASLHAGYSRREALEK